ncbi:hypothetical protein [Streptomyces sp. NBC_01803]|uniref:hypothetical protein n=1 Tax=Streptomyces sp. NBC_01803 TaxID=2975946 RepID=UPI003FA3A8AE
MTTAVFSAALVVSAAVGIPVGRLVDRDGPRTVMTAGSVVAVAALLVVAAAPHPVVFAAARLMAGAAMAATTPFATAAFAGPSGGYAPLLAVLSLLSALAAGLARGTGPQGARTSFTRS